MEKTSKYKAEESILRFSRAYAAEQLPWFAPALYRCSIVITEQVPIAGIDQQMNVYFNPFVVAKISASERKKSLRELGFLWIHEISHILRRHAERARENGFSAQLWNIAADFEINDGHWEGLFMPTDFPGLLPRDYLLPNGQLAENYYSLLRKEGDKSERLQRLLDLVMDEGSGVHSHSRIWELGSAPGTARQNVINDMVLSLVRKEVAQQLKQAPGNIPANWKRWVDEILQPKVDWRKVLRHRVKMALQLSVGGRLDYSYQRFSRRQSAYHPIFLPSLSGDIEMEIAVVVDTSGSISAQMLAQATGEVCGIMKRLRVPVTVIPCDARAYEPIKINTSSERIKLHQLSGGGGTNMNAGIKAALELSRKPDVIIVLTDGFTPWPTSKPEVSLLFGIFHRGGTSYPTPPMPPFNTASVIGIDLAKL
ncbi:VWA-like domain-containing protein [Lewinella sp. LCG006]|uniref:vWA domain-containing protein n=1 Tax=Lewinella sp. LCG006 TaxID=3231911 RepID=UPI0034600184